MLKRRCFLPLLAMIIPCLAGMITGCSHNGSSDFGNKTRGQQEATLRGSRDQLSPERKKEIEAQAQAMMASHSRPPAGGPATNNH